MNVFRACTGILCVCLVSILSAQDIFGEDVLNIHIHFSEEHWRDTLLDARLSGDNRRLEATVNINGQDYPGVQIRFKGNSSFYGAVKAGYKKIPFNMKAPDDMPFAGGYENLKLANNYRDPSAIRELLGYTIAGDYVPVPKCTYAAVHVNNEYLGVYTATEGVSKSMANRYFIGSKEGLIQAEPDFQRSDPPGCPKGSYASLEYLGPDFRCYEGLYEVRDSAAWAGLIHLTHVLRDSSEKLEGLLDIHLTLWMHAINNVLVNLDSYLGFFCHNYYLFRDNSGVYHPLIWDLNLAFGGFHVLKQGTSVDFATLSPIVHDRYDLRNRPLLTQLLKEDRYRHLYFAMIRTIVDQWLSNGKYLRTAGQLQLRIRQFVEMEENTFYSPESFEMNLNTSVKAGTRSVPGIEELMTARTEYLNRHPLLKPVKFALGAWTLSWTPGSTTIKANVIGELTRARLWYQTATREPFRPVNMDRVGNSADFTCTIRDMPVALYFEFEGEEQANLWPLNAPRVTLSAEQR